MRIGVSLAMLIALGSTAAAQIQPPPQPLPQPRIVGDQRYCLIERAAGTIACDFATMDQCQQAQATGRVGDCAVNPRPSTTGQGFRE
jgi:hypothetical protein